MSQREIKFRVWDESKSAYLYTALSPYVSEAETGGYRLIFGLLDDAWQGPYAIEQYTGLKDSAGREIYEGDILEEKWSAPAGEMESRYVIKFGVYEDGEGFPTLGFYKDHMCRAEVMPNESGGNLYPDNDRWVVVGNRHQNPELLA